MKSPIKRYTVPVVEESADPVNGACITITDSIYISQNSVPFFTDDASKAASNKLWRGLLIKGCNEGMWFKTEDPEPYFIEGNPGVFRRELCHVMLDRRGAWE